MDVKPDKLFLYHRVPASMVGTILLPLNTMKHSIPDVYHSQLQKYANRMHIPMRRIPLLDNCPWNDTIFMVAAHPQALVTAREAAGFNWTKKQRYFQIDPDTLDKEKLAVYLFDKNTPYDRNFATYNKADLASYSNVPEDTVEYFKEVRQTSANYIPLYFRYVPHILYRGPIDISKVTIIEV